MRLTRIGARSRARPAMSAGMPVVTAETIARPGRILRPGVPPMNRRVPPGPHPADGVASDREREQHAFAERGALLRCPFRAGLVVRATAREHDTWSMGVGRSSKNRSSEAASLASKAAVLRAASRASACFRRSGITGREDRRRALGPSAPGGELQADPGASADHDNGLPGQFRRMSGGIRGGRGGHQSAIGYYAVPCLAGGNYQYGAGAAPSRSIGRARGVLGSLPGGPEPTVVPGGEVGLQLWAWRH